jgi:Flp pilus assembly protein CpaB
MRASTVFALALALLIGLAAAAGAKAFGLFDKKAPPPAEKPAPYKVLVAKVNLFEDVTVTADQVMVREITAEEQEDLKARLGDKWKDKLMPGMVTAAHLRVVRRNLVADQVLLKEHFADQLLPDELSRRLEPNTRAVNVSVPKDRAAGGIIRVGEHVDVLLTTEVGYGNQKELRSACIARGCKVIMKRNNPWSVMAADPDDKPLHFTLQANLYRAALIEYSQQHGQVSLLPAPTPVRSAGTFSDPTSAEYATEDQRIEKVHQGVLHIGDKDLARIFNVVPPAPPAPKPVTPPPSVIQHLAGVKDAGYTVIPHGGYSYVVPPTQPPPAPSDTPAVQPAGGPGGMGAANPGDQTQPAGYTFRLPSATGNSGCKACDEKKKAAGQ